MGEHSHGPEIGKDEIFVFRQEVKRRARETHDNPHNIIAEAASNLSETAKTLLPPEKSLKKLCHRARPTPSSANPKSLCDLQIDENFSTLGGEKFLIYDSGPELDRIIMFGSEENKNIVSFSFGVYPFVMGICFHAFMSYGIFTPAVCRNSI